MCFFSFAARWGHLSPGIEEGIAADTFLHVCVIFLAHARIFSSHILGI